MHMCPAFRPRAVWRCRWEHNHSRDVQTRECATAGCHSVSFSIPASRKASQENGLGFRHNLSIQDPCLLMYQTTYWGIRSIGRSPALHAGGTGIETRILHFFLWFVVCCFPFLPPLLPSFFFFPSFFFPSFSSLLLFLLLFFSPSSSLPLLLLLFPFLSPSLSL